LTSTQVGGRRLGVVQDHEGKGADNGISGTVEGGRAEAACFRPSIEDGGRNPQQAAVPYSNEKRGGDVTARKRESGSGPQK